jgi:hypothetical protein
VIAAYELLTNDLYGLGIDPLLMGDTWDTVAKTVHDDGLGVSLILNKSEDVRSLIGRLMWYADCYVYSEAGKLEIKALRYTSLSGVPTVDEEDLTDEPSPTHGGWDNTWNQTRLEFTDRSKDYEESVEPFEDPANAAIVQAVVEEDVDAPWIHKRPIAKKVARRVGLRGGMPVMSWRLRLLPSWAATLTVGDRFYLDYDKLGVSQRLCRVTKVVEPSRQDPTCIVTAMEDFARGTDNDELPGDDYFGDHTVLDGEGNDAFTLTGTTPRLAWAPPLLMTYEERNNTSDGFMVACHRPTQATDGCTFHFTWNEGVRSYFPIGSIQNFPSYGTIGMWWGTGHPNRFLVEVDFATAEDLTQAEEFLNAPYDTYMVCMRYDVDTAAGTSYEGVDSIWFRRPEGAWWDQTETLRILIEVEVGAHGSDGPVLESTTDPGRLLATSVYFGKKTDFFLYNDLKIAWQRPISNTRGNWWGAPDSDPDKVRKIKALVSTHKDEQVLGDVLASTYDRDDTTQHPDGTQSESWGDKSLTGYEAFDVSGGNKVLGGVDELYERVEFMDLGLGRFVYGAELNIDQLLLQDIDTVLGWVTETGAAFYGKA